MYYLYGVKDVKASTFSPPFVARSNSEALRMIRQTMADPKTTLAQFPSDFELWLLCSFDETSGGVSMPTLSHLENLVNLRKDVDRE